MNKIVLSILTLALLAVPVAAQNSVYLNPQNSSESYCNITEVEIWVNAANLGSGQINLIYDPDCANVTKWTRNITNFPMGGESHYAGREWVTFMTLDQLTGDYMVGTLTIHCVHEGECTTPLAFADGSKLFDEGGSEISATWIDGTFGCSEKDTEPPYTTGHDPVPDATDVSIDTNITVHVRDNRSGVDKDTIVMAVGGDAVTPAITGDKSDYKLVYDHEIGYGQIVDVTVDASDLDGNAMHDAYSFTIESAPPENTVYLNPQNSSASYCNITEVEIWVNAANLGSGQINLIYDPDCANVTKWTRNITNFPMGGESHYVGREWVTFMTLDQLTGDYMVGTLTIHCVHEGECTTPLAFADGSKLFDEEGSEISATWIDGTFGEDTEPPYTTGHDPAPDATDVPIDTNIMVHVLDDGRGVDKDTVVMTVDGGAVTPAITGDKSDYTIVYDPMTDFGYGQVNVTVDASDLDGNAMPTDAYSFTIESAPHTVYLKPQHSRKPYCSTTEVEIWVNATDFQSGQINLIYDPGCANVTNCVLNTATFPISGWNSSVDGGEWITFMALSPLTGEYRIGTLTIHCVCEDECETALDFVDPSALFDSSGGEVPANWINGTFKCTIIDTTPPSVTSPTATPASIAADGIQTSQLNVTVTDPSGIGVVTVNLSAIGGSEAQVMEHIGENVYSTTTNASNDTEHGLHCLQVNASDVHGNCNDSVCIELVTSREVQFTIQLDAGWNMVSIPVIPADASVDAIFGDNITPPVYGYDAGYKSVTSLEPKKGYWVLADSPVDINITGTVPANREVTVFPGWNMIGPVSPDVQVSSFTGITLG